ncbi:murein L,D-transpeptidase [Jannaschia sp. W003]|uniref:L,D-transpeptidase family protein n=1 Tax=Jannaschia sp. W003 TaxID=2867012 RepID=UPI0021A8ADC3|nr:L,D-transpeptidase family protein [Jannaschia sp. W003]UWQ20257.1 L,D-transpeptidase family protein [Jannaschia sp. W003]
MTLHVRASLVALALAVAVPAGATSVAAPLLSPTRMAVAEAAAGAGEEGVAAFYRERAFAPIWLGDEAGPRRMAFLAAIAEAGAHGLPAARYDPVEIRAAFDAAHDAESLGALEVDMTRRLLRFASDLGGGVVKPGAASPFIHLERPRRDARADLEAFVADPLAFLRGLAPTSPRYARLLREKRRLEQAAAAGGWGAQVPVGILRRGDGGAAVIALRGRLEGMGYLERGLSPTFDGVMEAAVRRFQSDHGLAIDGAAGPATLAVVNRTANARLAQVLVNLERQRWMNKPLESRHVLVNLAEQHAYVVDDGAVTFDTVVVVGAPESDRQTPEFSHTMTHMVVNPSWYVPRSIATNEYLPQLKRGGARHLEVTYQGRTVDPRRVDFGQYTARTFPFSLRQPPGPSNALGKVKFMFPNKWNIYLHDTPAKSLFGRELRTFSHGCVRVGKPFELAHHLLAPQEVDPQGAFERILATGRERRVNLEAPIGVHLVYWTAWAGEDGAMRYRSDPYGRDAAVLDALRAAGVAPDGLGS